MEAPTNTLKVSKLDIVMLILLLMGISWTAGVSFYIVMSGDYYHSVGFPFFVVLLILATGVSSIGPVMMMRYVYKVGYSDGYDDGLVEGLHPSVPEHPEGSMKTLE